jgi:hypothetical protein
MFSDRSTSNTIEITDSEIRGTAPSVFAEAPMPGASNRYTFLPTGQILSAMRQEGWKPVEARQMGVRRLDHSGFQRHMVRFQRRDLAAEVGDYASEVILLNSHDRSSGYQIHAGLFRWVCRNGLMFADSLIPSVHVRHTAHELPEIIRASFQILEQLPRLADRVADFRAFNLADAVAQDFAPAGRLGDTVRGDLSKPRQTKSHASRKPCPLAPNQRKRRQSLPASWHTWAILAVVAFHALVYACEKPVQVCTWLTEHGGLFPLIRAVLWGKPAPAAPPAIVLKLPPLPPAA